MNADALEVATEAFNQAAGARPRLDGEALSTAIRALCGYRDVLRRCDRDELTQHNLKEINVLISLVHAVQFSLDAPPWTCLEQARVQLKGLADEAVSSPAHTTSS